MPNAPSSSSAPSFRSTPWFPRNYQALPANPAMRDSGWKLYVAHRAVRTVAALGNGNYAISPNAEFIPSPPPSQQEREEIYSDGRRGSFEPGYHPQFWNRSNGHLPFIHEVPESEEGVDPAYIMMDCERDGRYGTFRIVNRNAGRGAPARRFAQALLSLYEAELQRAEAFFSVDRERPMSLYLRPVAVQDSLYRFKNVEASLQSLRNDTAVIQRHLLELRAYSYRSYLQVAYDQGRLWTPCPDQAGVGCWLKDKDDELLKKLVWFGVPVWYIRQADSPPPHPLSPVLALNTRLSDEPWIEEDHGIPIEVGKRTRKRLRIRTSLISVKGCDGP
ncbi:hypothetical protein EVJ58_g8763 [Rhodofomes roseus]|uniref:Uncharacterized protein n=1 Tax=Rhodofomes roseus TaxID=34475 RepID=A0A4Y9XWJ1_9APHY|nr:hypothetical protein EVJ58_g8763 [Rhodofomes roseus]